MGISAPELKELENTPEHEAQMRSVNFKHLLFKMKLAEDDYQDEKRMKLRILRSAAPPLHTACEVCRGVRLCLDAIL